MDQESSCENEIKLEPTLVDAVNILTTLNAMRLNGDTADCILSTEDGGEFPVHRIVMLSCSDYFKALFTSSLNKDNRKHIMVPGIQAEILGQIIDNAYAQPLRIKEATIWDLVVAADMLLCKSLVQKCYNHLTVNMNPSTCLKLYQLSINYNMEEFKGAIHNYVVNNFRHIPTDSEALIDISEDALSDILQDDRLSMREEKLWDIMRIWLESRDDRQKFAPQLIKTLRMAFLGIDFIFKQIMCHPYVVNSPECRTIIGQRQDLMWQLAQVYSSTIVETPYIARPRLPQEILFSIGGYDKTFHETVGVIEIYDSKADLWCQYNKDLEISEAKRESHSCVYLNDCIYVLGGEERTTGRLHNTVNCWDLVRRKWYCIPPMKQQRSKFGAVVVSGTIIVIGGFQSNFRTLATAEQYHPRQNTWTFLESMRINRCSLAVAVLGKKIYVCGGSTNRLDSLKTVEMFNVENFTWTSVHSMNESRKGAAAVSLKNRIVVAGGKDNSSVETYDPESDTWIRISHMLEPRFNSTLAVLEGVLYAIGGSSTMDINSHVCGSEAYNEETNTWRPVSPSDHELTLRSTCVAQNVPDVQHYLCYNRNNLLEVKAKLVQTYKEKDENDKAKSALRLFS